jgi:hypothetical protein
VIEVEEWQAMLIGVVIAIVATAIWNLIDRRERLRVMTFEKRLKVHQEAFSWNQRAYHALNSRNVKDIRDIAQKGRDWWNDNSLFLDARSRKSLIAAFNSMEGYAHDLEYPQEAALGRDVWTHINESLRHITEGIGAKHLPITEQEANRTTEQTNLRLSGSFAARLQRIIEARWVRRYLLGGLFIMSLVTVVGLTIYSYWLIPISESFTEATRNSVICLDIAAILGLVAAYFGTRNRWLTLLLTIAIDIFIAGMIFELVSYIEKIH